MLSFKPRFITVDDFKNYFGKDLRSLMKNSDNPSREAELFLYRTEIRLINWIDSHTFRNIMYEELSDFQRDNFCLAILEQAMYFLKNGNLGIESGYDMEKGIIVSQEQIASIQIPQAVADYLHNAGLLNFNIINKHRSLRGYQSVNEFYPDGGGRAPFKSEK